MFPEIWHIRRLKCLNGFECWAVGDPQFWQDLRLGTDPERCSEFIETVLDEANGAPTPSAPLNSPRCKRKADTDDRRHDEVLAAVWSTTEIMVLNCHQSRFLSQRRGQAFLGMLRYPEFNIKDVQNSIVLLLLRLEWPIKECAVCTYNLRKPVDGIQRLGLVIRDYLELFREFMREPGGGSISTLRFALVSMLGVPTNRAAVFFRFPAGLSGIVRQELSMELTSCIENSCDLQARHFRRPVPASPLIPCTKALVYWLREFTLREARNSQPSLRQTVSVPDELSKRQARKKGKQGSES